MEGSEDVTRKALIVGYGNPLRGDDGIGQAAARALAQAPAICGAEVIACHQLLPELAESLAGVALAVFIDAAAGIPPGSVVVAPVQATAGPAAGLVHHVHPGALLLQSKKLYGHAPRPFLVTVGAGSLALGEGFSEDVAAALPGVIAAVRQLVLDHLPR
ncbi:MAG: hydrogenase maturation protease [Devosia sp.]|nr:hydrogenase maturation protease [Devosia sp.]